VIKAHLNLKVDADVVKKIKMRAIEENSTVSGITEELYREYLQRPKREKVKPKK
jgi:hypothetical protein